MNKKLIALAASMVFSTGVMASDYLLSDPQELLPNESIQSFAMSDLNGDGVNELVFVTSNGELKYSQLIGLGNGFLESSDLTIMKNTSGRTFKMNIALDGDTDEKTSLITRGGYIGVQDGSMNVRCRAKMQLVDGTIVAESSTGKITLTYTSRKYIAGKITCEQGKFKQSNEVAFTGYWGL